MLDIASITIHFYFSETYCKDKTFLFQWELQKDTYLTQQAEGTTLKIISHSWMTSVASYIICLCSAPGKTSVCFYVHFCEHYWFKFLFAFQFTTQNMRLHRATNYTA